MSTNKRSEVLQFGCRWEFWKKMRKNIRRLSASLSTNTKLTASSCFLTSTYQSGTTTMVNALNSNNRSTLLHTYLWTRWVSERILWLVYAQEHRLVMRHDAWHMPHKTHYMIIDSSILWRSFRSRWVLACQCSHCIFSSKSWRELCVGGLCYKA